MFGSSEGFGKRPSDTSLCFVLPKCWVSCCCELTDNSQIEQYSSVVWFIFEMHSGRGSGSFTFSDAFGRSLFAEQRVIIWLKFNKWFLFWRDTVKSCWFVVYSTSQLDLVALGIIFVVYKNATVISSYLWQCFWFVWKLKFSSLIKKLLSVWLTSLCVSRMLN